MHNAKCARRCNVLRLRHVSTWRERDGDTAPQQARGRRRGQQDARMILELLTNAKSVGIRSQSCEYYVS